MNIRDVEVNELETELLKMKDEKVLIYGDVNKDSEDEEDRGINLEGLKIKVDKNIITLFSFVNKEEYIIDLDSVLRIEDNETQDIKEIIIYMTNDEEVIIYCCGE